MKKIIFINLYNLYDKKIDAYEVGTDGFFRFGVGVFIADELMKQNYPVKCEMWRMDMRINRIMEKEIDGLKCKIFPSKRVSFFGKNFGEYSNEFKKALVLEKTIQDVIFHIMPNHGFTMSLISLFVSPSKIIWSHLGGPNAYWRFKNDKNFNSFFYYLFEKHVVLKGQNQHTFTISKSEYEYLRMIKTPVSFMPIFGIPMPETLKIIDRNDIRQKLGINTSKKIILQVGRAVKERGFDWIIEYLNSPLAENYFWIFAGIHKEDEYYDELSKRNVLITDYLTRHELVEYYNSSDVLIILLNEKSDLEFGGTGYVPLESLACGTPVVATTFLSFPGVDHHAVSRTPKTKEEVMPMVEELLNENINRQMCREVALKNFSWDVVLKKHWEIYNS